MIRNFKNNSVLKEGIVYKMRCLEKQDAITGSGCDLSLDAPFKTMGGNANFEKNEEGPYHHVKQSTLLKAKTCKI